MTCFESILEDLEDNENPLVRGECCLGLEERIIPLQDLELIPNFSQNSKITPESLKSAEDLYNNIKSSEYTVLSIPKTSRIVVYNDNNEEVGKLKYHFNDIKKELMFIDEIKVYKKEQDYSLDKKYITKMLIDEAIELGSTKNKIETLLKVNESNNFAMGICQHRELYQAKDSSYVFIENSKIE